MKAFLNDSDTYKCEIQLLINMHEQALLISALRQVAEESYRIDPLISAFYRHIIDELRAQFKLSDYIESPSSLIY